MACQFCRIVSGEVPAAVIYEDEISLAFLDRRPLFPGHTLLVPRAHCETLQDLPLELVLRFFVNTQRLAAAVELGLAAAGSFIAINNRVSQSVPHLHVHVVPRRPKDGLKGFFWPRQPYKNDAELQETAARLRAAVLTLLTAPSGEDRGKRL